MENQGDVPLTPPRTPSSGRMQPVDADVVATVPTPKRPVFRFSIQDDILLLRQVLAREDPFVRGSSAFGEISKALYSVERFKDLSCRSFRDRTVLLVEEYARGDNYRRKQ